MRTRYLLLKSATFSVTLFWLGCQVGPPPVDEAENAVSAYTLYGPASIDIMPLTEIASAEGGEATSQLKAYISLLDSFGCQVKAPGVFRFELYEYEPRSPEYKGKRASIWPDIDLTRPAHNNEYWRDYLRAYEFVLDLEPEGNRNYVLQVTCLCPSRRRLSNNFTLRYAK